MKFSVDVENISKILFLDFSFFENMSLKNISAWLGGNLLLRLLPETVVAGHNSKNNSNKLFFFNERDSEQTITARWLPFIIMIKY